MTPYAHIRLSLPVDTSHNESDNQALAKIGTRIKRSRKHLGLTQDALARLGGATSNRGIQDNEAGKTLPGANVIFALIKAGINANWLLSGEGAMLLADIIEKPATADLDRERMSESIETVEFVLASAGRTMAPEKKTELIMAVYDLLGDQGEIKERVLKLIKSVA